MSNLKRCPNCGEYPGVRRKYCAKGACQKAASAERSRRHQVRKDAGLVGVTVDVPGLPEDDSEAFAAPWGVSYGSEAEAYADCILTGGLSGNVPGHIQAARLAMLEAAA